MAMNDYAIPDASPLPGPAPQRVPGVLMGEALRHILDVELARSRRYESPFVLLRVVVGAAAGFPGEQTAGIVRKVAGAVRGATRWADTVGAEDDGSLLIILRETDAGGAGAVVSKIQQRMEGLLDGSELARIRIEKAAWRKGDDLDSLRARFA
jgi:hypothetical protein